MSGKIPASLGKMKNLHKLQLQGNKFEGELAGKVEEPSNQAYDTAKQEVPAPDESGEEELDLDLGL